MFEAGVRGLPGSFLRETCRSRLAGDRGISASINVELEILIAGKPAPTRLVFQRKRYGISTFTAPVGQSFSHGMQYQHSSKAM